MTTPALPRPLPAPPVGPESRPFYEAAAEGRLLIKHCDNCDRPHWYPRTLCPHCFSPRTRWVESRGHGTLYAFSVLRRGVDTPYALAYVTLAEGVTLLTNIVDCDLDALAIGQAVQLRFIATEGGPSFPMFTPRPTA